MEIYFVFCTLTLAAGFITLLGIAFYHHAQHRIQKIKQALTKTGATDIKISDKFMLEDLFPTTIHDYVYKRDRTIFNVSYKDAKGIPHTTMCWFYTLSSDIHWQDHP
jgi:hypothetical protein